MTERQEKNTAIVPVRMNPRRINRPEDVREILEFAW